jgi:hypothetical protein
MCVEYIYVEYIYVDLHIDARRRESWLGEREQKKLEAIVARAVVRAREVVIAML